MIYGNLYLLLWIFAFNMLKGATINLILNLYHQKVHLYIKILHTKSCICWLCSFILNIYCLFHIITAQNPIFLRRYWYSVFSLKWVNVRKTMFTRTRDHTIKLQLCLHKYQEGSILIWMINHPIFHCFLTRKVIPHFIYSLRFLI